MKVAFMTVLFLTLASCKYDLSYMTDVERYRQAKKSLVNGNYDLQTSKKIELNKFTISDGPFDVKTESGEKFIGLIQMYIEPYTQKTTCLAFYKKANLLDDLNAKTTVKDCSCVRAKATVPLINGYTQMSESNIKTLENISRFGWTKKLYSKFLGRSRNIFRGDYVYEDEEFMRFQNFSFEFDRKNNEFVVDTLAGGNLYATTITNKTYRLPIQSLQQKVDADGTINFLVWAKSLDGFVSQEARVMSMAAMNPALQHLKSAEELLHFDEPGIMDGNFYKVQDGFDIGDLTPISVESYALIISYNPSLPNELTVSPFMPLDEKLKGANFRYYLNNEIGYNNF